MINLVLENRKRAKVHCETLLIALKEDSGMRLMNNKIAQEIIICDLPYSVIFVHQLIESRSIVKQNHY